MNADADDQRIERLITMAQRLVEAMQHDIESLKAGKPRDLHMLTPDIQRLTALYSREASTLSPEIADNAPGELRRRLVDITATFRDVLAAQTRLLTRLRGASEGMIRAVVDEVERQRAPMRSYGAKPTAAARSSGAMLYNSVV